MADDQVAMVKQANDIVEVVGEYVKLVKQGRVYKALCPFHDDHRPSMDVNPARQAFRCWACGKYGDVFQFVMDKERIDFREALELLARRARITLKRGDPVQAQTRARMYDLMKWAEEQFHSTLVDSAAGAEARQYLESRHLTPETIKKYALGYARNSWEWLTNKALKAGWQADLLVKVGLSAQREGENSHYDRFRDRVIFPIRDVRGRTVGFGGRILPSSSSSAQQSKYYNSSETPLFSKSENLYGIDQARDCAEKAGWLAVVEGYTDVLMAHQHGIMNVVATLGTALNEKHIKQLRRFVPRVVLTFDADAGGTSGVDRALELFVSQDVDLAVASLPVGLDPCDLLVKHGRETFEAALANAVDALEFKLAQVLTTERMASIEGRRTAVDEVLRILALAPEMAGHATSVKRELIVSRLAQRVNLKEETLWSRLKELRRAGGVSSRSSTETADNSSAGEQQGPADIAERQLLEVLLAEPDLIERAQKEVGPDEVAHPGLRRLLQELYSLHDVGETPSADQLRARLVDHPRLAEYVLRLQSAGLMNVQRPAWLEDLVAVFRQRRMSSQVTELRGRLQTTPADGPVPVELLRQLQEKTCTRV